MQISCLIGSRWKYYNTIWKYFVTQNDILSKKDGSDLNAWLMVKKEEELSFSLQNTLIVNWSQILKTLFDSIVFNRIWFCFVWILKTFFLVSTPHSIRGESIGQIILLHRISTIRPSSNLDKLIVGLEIMGWELKTP